MATESELRSRLAALKSQGKTESTSKEAGKIARQLREGNYSSGGSGEYGGESDFGGTIQKALDMSMQFIRPALESFESSRNTLEDRYSQLLDEIRGREERSVQDTRMVQSRELGRRGILPSSGLYEQSVSQAVEPVRQEYGYMANEAAYNQAQSINAVNQAIAQLQAGAGQSGLNTALNLLGLQQGQNQFDTSMQLQRDVLNQVTLPQLEYELNKPYYQPETDYTGLLTALFGDQFGDSRSGGSGAGQSPQYTPARDGIIEGNWVSRGGRWVPRYEVVG